MAETTQSVRRRVALKVGRGLAGALLAALCLVGGNAGAATDLPAGPVSGLPVPRFVSLKSDRTNVRAGPNKDQDVRWVYTRAGMPVEVTAEFENWRRIRDWEGSEGWVYHSLLSGRRSGVIVPSKNEELVPLYQEPDAKSGVMARLQPGVLAQIKSCDGNWCQIVGKSFSGYIVQERLWGAYPHEKID
ncbi:aspartyl-trna synthetase [Undibacter mobilis]|uniref:Aspartyl-trna synthetase n=1 Tax=Undibacter mobilis TaxID=2292256 RepID=A0A371B9I8_9BRAD|nr:aspartyl-trna synthetase [Undibacter mobilis]